MVSISKQKEQTVEVICAQGCKYVNQLLASPTLQADNVHLQALDSKNQQWVLAELNAVMNVYSDSGSCSI